MRKTLTYLLAACVLATAGGLTSCATRTPQQKKTAAYKRQAKRGKVPCPCDSH